jgi:DNA-3-methyladenine glycosylase II
LPNFIFPENPRNTALEGETKMPATNTGGMDLDSAVETLKKRDSVLRHIINRIGPCTLTLEPHAFKALAESILYQQLSIKAASTIVKRFTALYPERPFPGPEDILNTTDEDLRSAGISGQKARYLKDLSLKFQEGIITPTKFPEMDDEEIIEHLVQVKGIGRWTAEMFLIFSLGRPDVLPVDDFGLRKAVGKHYGTGDLASPEQTRKIAETWQPYRTFATWYLWKSLDAAPLER